jgi:hypothetical protein
MVHFFRLPDSCEMPGAPAASKATPKVDTTRRDWVARATPLY